MPPKLGQFETFTLEQLAEGIYAFKTFDGHYLTAVNGGGMGTAGAPLHTDQTASNRFRDCSCSLG